MNSFSFKLFNRQSRRIVATVGLLCATVLPGVVPGLVSAAQMTERSIELSNSSVSSTNVTYKVSFTAATAAGAFVVDFCNNSPVIGAACTPPVGFDASAAASTTTDFTAVTGATSQVVVTGVIAASDAVSVELTGIKNPSEAGSMYARIVTFDTVGEANTYTSSIPGANLRDEGGVAMSITPTIGVSGSVLESLVFCASNVAFDDEGCASENLEAPNVSLGVDGVLGTAVSDGTIYSLISTNAATGAVVNLKSNTVGCGGLVRVGAANCDIKPITTAGLIDEGAAQFGLKLGTIDGGTGQITPMSNYATGTYFLGWVTGDQSGVTSAYGDQIYNTTNAPVSNAMVPLIFGANVGNDTPAGAYSATLNLIATGKF